jgi:hypothetical protein
MLRADAAALGPIDADHYLPGGLANIAALLLRPAKVWRPPIPPFREAGESAVAMQRALRDRGMRIQHFPFFRNGYMLHLGRGTLREVAERNNTRNRYYDWAVENRSFHFDGNPDGPRLLSSFLATFYDEVGEFTPENLVDACIRRERIVGPSN